jgi:RNA polymerase sigma factor (TIGR02999 family)
MSEVTQILSAIQQGDRSASEQLLPLVYNELRKLAAQRLSRESPGMTLQPTALVHEAYVRLVDRPRSESSEGVQWDSMGHFFAAAAEAMRRILIERARRKKRIKHGGELAQVDLLDGDLSVEPPSEDILALDEALVRLNDHDPEAAQVVQLHFFAGLPIEKVAGALGISRATAYRNWSYARAWLRCAISPGEEDPNR